MAARCALLVAVCAAAAGLSIDQLPQQNVENVSAAPDPVVSDTAGLLGAGLPKLSAEASRLQQETRIVLAAVILPEMPEDAEPVDILDRWDLGEDGVLLLVSVAERKSHIHARRRAKEVLSDAAARRILDAMRPALRQGDYAAAMVGAARDMRLEATTGECNADEEEDNYDFLFLVVPVFFALITSWLERRRSRKRAEARLRRMKDLSHKGEGFDCQETCAICLEKLGSKPTAMPNTTGKAEDEEAEEEDAVVVLPCRHAFHRRCLKRWLDVRDHCPVCRVKDPLLTGHDDADGDTPRAADTAGSSDGWDVSGIDSSFGAASMGVSGSW